MAFGFFWIKAFGFFWLLAFGFWVLLSFGFFWLFTFGLFWLLAFDFWVLCGDFTQLLERLLRRRRLQASSRARLYVVYISRLAFPSPAGAEEKEEEDVKEEGEKQEKEKKEEKERIGICGSDPSRSKKSWGCIPL